MAAEIESSYITPISNQRMTRGEFFGLATSAAKGIGWASLIYGLSENAKLDIVFQQEKRTGVPAPLNPQQFTYVKPVYEKIEQDIPPGASDERRTEIFINNTNQVDDPLKRKILISTLDERLRNISRVYRALRTATIGVGLAAVTGIYSTLGHYAKNKELDQEERSNTQSEEYVRESRALFVLTRELLRKHGHLQVNAGGQSSWVLKDPPVIYIDASKEYVSIFAPEIDILEGPKTIKIGSTSFGKAFLVVKEGSCEIATPDFREIEEITKPATLEEIKAYAKNVQTLKELYDYRSELSEQ